MVQIFFEKMVNTWRLQMNGKDFIFPHWSFVIKKGHVEIGLFKRMHAWALLGKNLI